MNTTQILITILICLSAQLTEAQYALYFPNNETELIQLERPKQLSFAAITGFETARNLQLGYSPFKHISIAGGFFHQNNGYGQGSLRFRKALSLSVGSYFLLGKGNSTTDEYGSVPDSVQHNNQWLVTTQLGYSTNEMSTAAFLGTNGSFSSDLEYRSLFLTLSLSYKYRLGLFTVSGSYRRLYYQKGIFGGSAIGENQIEAITNELQNPSSYGVFNIGVQNRVGMPKKILELIIGGNLPAVYFQNFEDQAATVDRMLLYMGVSLDLGKLATYGKTKFKR